MKAVAVQQWKGRVAARPRWPTTAQRTTPQAPRLASRRAEWLLAGITLSMVVPILDIPFLGVSLSFLFFAALGLEVVRGGIPWQLQLHQPLLAAALGYGSASLISFVANWLGKEGLSWNELLLAFRLPYWVGCMVVTALVVSFMPGPGAVVRASGVGIILLGIAFLPGVLVGQIPLIVGELGFTQNTLGLIFSTFWPAALYVAVTARKRWIAWIAVMLLLSAVVINASRGSWVAIAFATSAAVGVLLRAGRLGVRVAWRVVAGVLLVGGLVVVLGPTITPEATIARIASRADSFEELAWDASYQTRVAMRRKAWSLFRENPLLGVGPGRFTREDAEFDLPARLRGKSLERLNRKNSHSAYFQLIAETGLVGAAPYALLLLYLFLAGYRAAVRLARAGELWGVAVFLSFLGMSIHLVVVAGLLGTLPWFVYGLLGGTIAWARRRLADQRAPTRLLAGQRWGAGRRA